MPVQDPFIPGDRDSLGKARRGYAQLAMSSSCLLLLVVGLLVSGRSATFAAAAPAAASAATPTPSPVTLYVLSSGSTQAQRCARQSTADETTYGSALQKIAQQRLGSAFALATPTVGAIDAATLVSAAPGTYIVVASYCKNGDILNFSVTGYSPVSPPGIVPNTGSLSGTLDGLWASDWSGIFGPISSPLVPNVGFYPVANDTTNIVNPRMEHNLPVTPLQTPGPAPTATPAPGTPGIPTTRFAACRQSGDHVLIVGRIIILSNPSADDIGKLAVGAAGIKVSQPPPWGGIYTAIGVALSALYGPNRAEVGADVFVCPSDSPTEVYWVGGQSITGHATTPLFNPSPEQVERALDLATTDLENQLACILHHEPYVNPDNPQPTDIQPPFSDLSPSLKPWCDGDGTALHPGYWSNLLADAQKKFPNTTINAREPGPPTYNSPLDAGLRTLPTTSPKR